MIRLSACTLMLAFALAVFPGCASQQPAPEQNQAAHERAPQSNHDQAQSDPDNPISAMFNWPLQVLENIVP